MIRPGSWPAFTGTGQVMIICVCRLSTMGYKPEPNRHEFDKPGSSVNVQGIIANVVSERVWAFASSSPTEILRHHDVTTSSRDDLSLQASLRHRHRLCLM